MQTHVYLRPPKKMLEQRREAEIIPSSQRISDVTDKTIRGADLHIVKSDIRRRDPERILDNEATGFVDKKGPAIFGF